MSEKSGLGGPIDFLFEMRTVVHTHFRENISPRFEETRIGDSLDGRLYPAYSQNNTHLTKWCWCDHNNLITTSTTSGRRSRLSFIFDIEMVWNQKLCIFSKSNQVEIQAKYQCQQRVSHFDHKNSPTSIPEKNYLHDTKCVVCRDRGPVSDITLTCLWHGDSWHRQNVLHGIRGLTISYMSFLDTQCFSVPPPPPPRSKN